MGNVLTVTLNPTVDLSTATASVVAGPKLRCDTPVAEPGGGGINVSRAIRFLGGTSTAFVAVSGETGARLLRLLAAEGVTFTAFSVRGDTRQSIAITDRETGKQFRFVMPGPSWTEDMETEALHAIAAEAKPDSYVVLSGSQPPGVGDTFTTRLADMLAAKNARLFVDTSGAPLAAVAAHKGTAPFVLRMDDVEAVDLAGRPLPTRKDTADFAEKLVDSGAAEMVIVARGPDGSTLATRQGRWHCTRAVDPSQVRSAVGAGDSFVGAFVMALAKGDTPVEALRRGTAAASAAVLTDGTQLCSAAGVEKLLAGCQTTQV